MSRNLDMVKARLICIEAEAQWLKEHYGLSHEDYQISLNAISSWVGEIEEELNHESNHYHT